jgi:hypothetical protein
MNIAKIVLAGSAAFTIISSAALAQQALNGTITGLNRLNGTITIQQTQSGTVGANTGGANTGGAAQEGAAEEFKVQDVSSLDDLHAGNRVSFSVTEKDGIKTITKLQKQ